MILTDEERTILVDVLVYHYRKNSASCGCGWAELGRSHPEHVVDVFEQALEYYRGEGK